jgi:hypothetical protein
MINAIIGLTYVIVFAIGIKFGMTLNKKER